MVAVLEVVTPYEHNTLPDASINSVFTSWTVHFLVAENYCVRKMKNGAKQATAPSTTTGIRSWRAQKIDMYFTFLLYSSRWPGAEQTLCFIDRLIDWVSPKESLDVIAQVSRHSTREKPTITGDYRRGRRELAERQIKSLIIGTKNWRPDPGAEFFLFFENERKVLSNSIRGTAMGAPEDLEPDPTDKIFTFSTRRDIWNEGAKDGRTANLLSMIEHFFVEADCSYGYGHERRYIISGPFDLIGELSSTRPLRIMDFDFRRGIPGVYLYNYLSALLLNKAENPESLCRLSGVTCATLGGVGNAAKGLAIYVERYEPDVLTNVGKHPHKLLDLENLVN